MRKTHLLVLVVVVVIAVLAIGAVAAYAGMTPSDTQSPATTTNAAGSYWNTMAITATATDGAGVAYIYTKVDEHAVRLVPVQGQPLSATATIPERRDLPLGAGIHTIKYWAQDINGNVEGQHTIKVTLAVDADKPVTSATGATDGAWYNAAVPVHLAAADGAAGSGVKQLSCALDGAAPTVVDAGAADVTVPATNGPHTIVYSATDVAGNAEKAKTLTVNVDVTKPVTAASAASVARGKTATLKFRVTDAGAGSSTATVVIKVKNRARRIVATIKAGQVAANARVSVRFKCRLAAGAYTYSVHARDAAGNVQAKAGSARLTVR